MLCAAVITTTLMLPMLFSMPDGGTAALTADNCADLYRIGATWSYQWHPWPHQCADIQMVPMIWGADFYSPTAAPSPYILGPNEPNRPDQANMTPQEGAVFWHSKMEVDYRWRIKGSPSPTEVEWLRKWRLAYILMYNKEPDIGFISGHIYRTSLEDARVLLAEWVKLAQEWNLDLWITEYSAVPCWMYPKTALPMAEALTRDLRQTLEVARYAWFGSRLTGAEEWYPWPDSCLTGLYDADGVTEFGQWFQLRGMM
jgi:hypothetical protein